MKNIFLTMISMTIMVLGVVSCKSTKTSLADRAIPFGISAIPCKDVPSTDAIDSQVGHLECDGITISYDYGRYANPGPITPKEEFRRSFDTYHHIKFFEDRMIDLYGRPVSIPRNLQRKAIGSQRCYIGREGSIPT